MTFARGLFSSTVLIVGACSVAPEVSKPVSRGYDLSLTHPAPYATYVQVSPGARGSALPTPQQIISPDFSLYLRKVTGCVRDTSRPTEALGGAQVPAGYMVPVSCP